MGRLSHGIRSGSRYVRRYGWAVLILGCLVRPGVAETDRHALLVGIDLYGPEEPVDRLGSDEEGQRRWTDLKGAVHDVTAVARLLEETRGYPSRNVRLLLNREATRKGILEALDGLAERVSAGDPVLFYYSGHGSQIVYTGPDGELREPDGRDETIVPADSHEGAPDLRDWELRRALHRVLDRGALLTVVLDSCHSGSGVRDRGEGPAIRALAPVSGPAPPGGELGLLLEDRGALVLSAAQAHQQAFERVEGDRVHGAFTLALLHAMRSAGVYESAEHTFRRARGFLEAWRRRQRPAISGDADALSRPLFGERTDRADDRIVVAVGEVSPGRRVTLEGGWIQGLSKGSELVLVGHERPRLRVESLSGLARSTARVLDEGPSRSSVDPLESGDLVSLESWSAPPGDPLRIFLGDSADPANVGADVGPDVVSALGRHEFLSRSRVEIVRDPLRADYGLRIRWSSETREASWQRTFWPRSPNPTSAAELDTVAPSEAPDVLPSETPWRTLGKAATNDPPTIRGLIEDLRRLVRVFGWQTLRSPWEFSYHLALRERDGDPVDPLSGGALIAGRHYEAALQWSGHGAPRKVSDRYVYIFSVDGQGRGSLLYPRRGSVDNRFPGAHRGSWIPLGREAGFQVVPPLGTDTYCLLTSSEPIPDPWVFEWDGLRPREPSRNALEQLLSQVVSGSRGGFTSTRVRWSIDRFIVQSVAAEP